MRSLWITTAILLGWALGVPTAAPAAEGQASSPMSTQGVESQKQQPSVGDMPIYKPRRQSIPKGRVGGGIRGGDGPALYVLAPDHVGFTKDEQPSLLWYLSKTTSLPLEFTVIDTRAVKPLLETRLKTPVQPGVQRISLKNFDIKLEPGVQYKWFVTLVLGPEASSKDVVAGGTIERIPFIEALSIHLAAAKNSDAVFRYAEAGLWYDAIATISELIDKAPDDRKLRQQRASLLQQVGLWEVANSDFKPATREEEP